MNKNVKLICILIVSFILIVIGVYGYFNTHNSNSNSIISNITNNNDSIVTRVTNLNEFYRVKNALTKFYILCREYNVPENVKYEYEESYDLNAVLKEIYSILDKEYLKEYNVNMENISQKIEDFRANEIQVNDIYRIQKDKKISMYLVYFSELSISDENEKDIYFILKLDDEEKCFSVYLEDYVKDNNCDKLEENKEIKIKINDIESNNINIYENTVVYSSKYQEDLFNDFKKSCMSNIKRAYLLLDEECKSNKFDTFEKFSSYISNKMSDIIVMKIQNCKVEKNEGNTLYTYTTNKEFTFTLKEIAPLKYTVVIE